MKRTTKIIGNVLYGIVFAALLLMIVMVISSRASGGEPQLFGYQFKTVLSGSMEPTFKTGSLIVVKEVKDAKILKENDVITFRQDEKNVVTHRIVEVVKQGDNVFYRTKGDNNEEADVNPVMTQNVVAKYSGITIPFIGYFLNYASTPLGTGLLLIIPGLLLLGYAAWTIRLAIKEIEEKTKVASAPDQKQIVS
ncbi:signal peptidase I SipW [Mesobacillus selenatarsenatis]|uniref:Signal peptidase I n=1 Tax=Mesobacillus selenatarsenatis (strain DSM 18680 / JCM 14380 / FERM P-15431 / SF-1) TaxID=1321606 RepID=A0A0A8X670_MESS1|nr:signal peptidase I [Mesobacillus selenatarsenatis]GAM15445.1 signal peptidase SipW, required for TasA secretion [Mesobacillus selenatarsenatis SF-1]